MTSALAKLDIGAQGGLLRDKTATKKDDLHHLWFQGVFSQDAPSWTAGRTADCEGGAIADEGMLLRIR